MLPGFVAKELTMFSYKSTGLVARPNRKKTAWQQLLRSIRADVGENDSAAPTTLHSLTPAQRTNVS